MRYTGPRIKFVVAFMSIAMVLVAMSSAATAAPSYRELPRPKGYPAQCSLATKCPIEIIGAGIPESDKCSERVVVFYGSNNYDCNRKLCIASARRHAFLWNSRHEVRIAIPTGLGIPWAFFEEQWRQIKINAAMTQEASNQLLDCGLVWTNGYIHTQGYYFHQVFLPAFEKTTPKVAFSIAGGGIKPPKNVVLKLVHRFASKFKIGGEDKYGGWTLRTAITGTGGLNVSISKT